MRTVVLRFAGFGILPILSLLVSFATLPIIARVGGSSGWIGVGFGQSIGAIGAILIGLGWSLHGPHRVAHVDRRVARIQYVRSVQERFGVAVIVLPVVVLLTLWIADAEWRSVAVVACVSVAVGGFSPTWYWVGIGAPRQSLVYDTMPRIFANIAAIPFVIITGQVILFPALTLVLVAAAYVVFSVKMKTFSTLWQPRRLTALSASVKNNAAASLTVIASGAYTSASASLVTIFAPPAAVALFISGQKIYSLSGQSVNVSGNALQGWVSESALPEQRSKRRKFSLALHASLGVMGGLALGVLGTPVTGLLFTEELSAPRGAMAAFGFAFFALSCNSGIGRTYLAPMGLMRILLVSTVLGAVVGLPSIIILSATFGAIGAATGVALAEGVVLVLQVLALLLLKWRKSR